jgi:hypothetical protein
MRKPENYLIDKDILLGVAGSVSKFTDSRTYRYRSFTPYRYICAHASNSQKEIDCLEKVQKRAVGIINGLHTRP